MSQRRPILKSGLVWIAATSIAVAAFAQAAAEAFPLWAASTTDIETSLVADAHAEFVDRLHRAEIAAEGQGAFAAGTVPTASRQLQRRARTAYLLNPLDAAVIRTLAMGTVLPSDTERGRRAMHIAAMVSSRDLLTNLWLAQDYALANDLNAALTTLDAALRTSSAARESAMNPLLQLLASPESHEPLGKLLKRRPEWEWSFWFAFSSNPVALQNAAIFMRNASISPSDISAIQPQLLQRLYQRLKSADLYDQLFGLATLDPEARRLIESQRQGDFRTSDEASPFSWQFLSAGSYSTYVDPGSGTVRIDAERHSQGAAGRLILPVGDNPLVFQVSAQVPASTLLRVEAGCAVGTRSQPMVRMLLTDQVGASSSKIEDSDCDYLAVQLSFDASASDQPSSIIVERIAFVPAGQAH